MSSNKGKLFVISGPSGSGKSSVCEEVAQRTGIPCSISATTRPPRVGEENGVHYYFLSHNEFAARVDGDLFYEHAEVYGQQYGTPKEPIEKLLSNGGGCLLEVDVQGARSVRSRCADAVLIFIAPPTLEELRTRLENRGTESDERIDIRLSRAAEEIQRQGEYDYVVVNNDLAAARDEVTRIVESET